MAPAFLHLDCIAARSGTSRSTVQRALREAQLLGLIVVQERRRAGQRSLTNIVRVISQEWRTWLRLSDKGRRSFPQHPQTKFTPTQDRHRGDLAAERRGDGALRGGGD